MGRRARERLRAGGLCPGGGDRPGADHRTGSMGRRVPGKKAFRGPEQLCPGRERPESVPGEQGSTRNPGLELARSESGEAFRARGRLSPGPGVESCPGDGSTRTGLMARRMRGRFRAGALLRAEVIVPGVDHCTGLMGRRARWYDPGPGRFILAEAIVPGTSRRTGLMGRRMRGRLRAGALLRAEVIAPGVGHPHRVDGPSGAGGRPRGRALHPGRMGIGAGNWITDRGPMGPVRAAGTGYRGGGGIHPDPGIRMGAGPGIGRGKRASGGQGGGSIPGNGEGRNRGPGGTGGPGRNPGVQNWGARELWGRPGEKGISRGARGGASIPGAGITRNPVAPGGDRGSTRNPGVWSGGPAQGRR